MKEDINLFSNNFSTSKIPQEPGVYIIKSKYNEILYVGKAKILRNRIKSYLNRNNLGFFKQSMMREAENVEFIITKSELEALLLESNLIKEHRPPYNIILRDDKSYPYLRITMHEKYPRVMVARGIKNRRDFYFGPVTPVKKLKFLIKTLKSTYKVAQKNDKSCQSYHKPCIYYQMGRCSAPCAHKISKEEYDRLISEIKHTLSNPKGLKSRLKQQLEILSKNEQYEEAIDVRNRLQVLELLQDKQVASEFNEDFLDAVAFAEEDNIICAYILNIRFSNMTGNRNYFFYNTVLDSDFSENFLMQYYSYGKEIIPDIILTYGINDSELIEKALSREKHVKVVVPQRGKKKRLLDIAQKNAQIALKNYMHYIKNSVDNLKKLQNTLKLNTVPYVIDVIDISHISFTNVVAGVIRYEIGGFNKDMYRRYALKSKYESDAMQEAASRHIELLVKTKKVLPDLILTDGGIIQANAVYNVTGITTLGIAKEKQSGRTVRSKGEVEDSIYYCGEKVDIDDNLLQFLQKMRDEAHRFAVSYHRKKREQYVIASVLDRVKFIGEKRKKALFEHFGSIENIKDASIEELSSINGISRKMALSIKEKLKNY